ncbi:MAG: DUF6107 family protein [Rhizobiaceae bacterium]
MTSRFSGVFSDALTTSLGEAVPALWGAKILGAFAGSLVSLAYVMPRGRRDAAARLLVGLVTGLVFGGTAGVKLADVMGLLGKISAFEITLMGATLSSLCAWWSLGALQRLVERWPGFSLTAAKKDRKTQ